MPRLSKLPRAVTRHTLETGYDPDAPGKMLGKFSRSIFGRVRIQILQRQSGELVPILSSQTRHLTIRLC